MKKVFEFESYKDFVKARIESMPQQGRGQFRKLAEELRMHTSLVSQVFGGDRHLTAEQACDLCLFWGLSALETEMFLALVQLERAGSKNLKSVIKEQIEQIRKRSDKLSHRLKQEKQMNDHTRSIFYSNWYYSAIRLLTSIPDYQTVDAISEFYELPRSLVSKVVDFLVDHNLCIEEKNGKIKMGPQRTHLPSDSPLISRHHTNWRLKSISKSERLTENELIFTAPLSISKKDAIEVRKKILALIEDVSSTVKDSKAEKVACLNIDWFDVEA